jgi:anti-anti-sigma regulatory factor
VTAAKVIKINIQENDGIMNVYPSFPLDEATVAQFSNDTKQWLIKPIKAFVIDLKGCTELPRSMISAVTQFSLSLKKAEKFLFCLNIGDTLTRELRQQGLLGTFHPIRDIDEAKTIAGITQNKTSGKFSTEIFNPFIDGTMHVFRGLNRDRADGSKTKAKEP